MAKSRKRSKGQNQPRAKKKPVRHDLRVLRYHDGIVSEVDVNVTALSLEELFPADQVTWISLIGVQPEVVRDLGKHVSLHKLTVEDILNSEQRSKLEDYDNHLFMTLRTVLTGSGVQTEQLSLVVGQNFVLTFEERPNHATELVRDRIRKGRGQIQLQRAGYLTYSILDAVIDHLMQVVETFGERLEDLEDVVLLGKASNNQLLDARHDLQALRRVASSIREVVIRLRQETTPFVSAETRIYLRDCLDHITRVEEAIESWREFSSTLMDIHLAVSSQQLNEVMKVLTIITTIFIPLSFLVGLYGMNFNRDASPWNMPELDAYWGYPIALAVMGLIVVLQLLYFRARGWLSFGDKKAPEADATN